MQIVLRLDCEYCQGVELRLERGRREEETASRDCCTNGEEISCVAPLLYLILIPSVILKLESVSSQCARL